VNVATAEKLELFAFTCTSDFVELVSLLTILKARLGAIVNNGATCHFCPNKSKFANFVLTSGWPIRTADGKTVQVTSTGCIEIALPNGKGQMTVILKDALCSPNLAFTLISVSCLLKAGCGVILCTIECLDEWVMCILLLTNHEFESA
jgi:hypothetical protein